MIKTVFSVIMIVFAVLGLTEFLHSLSIKIISSDKKRNIAAVIRLNETNALEQLYFAYAQLKWLDSDYCNIIIGVTDDLSENSISMCKKFADKKSIVLVPNEFVQNVISSVF